jgi:hypothetical protein
MPLPPALNPPTTQESSVRYGQKTDPQTGISETFTEQDMQVALVTPLLGDANVEITPTDRYMSLVRSLTVPGADILAFSRTWNETSAIKLPATLDSLTIIYETSSGEGTSDETATGASVGTNPNLSIALNGSAQSSAAIIPDIQIDIQEHSLGNAPVIKVVFYSAQGDGMADILTRLTAIVGVNVDSWPEFDKSEKALVFTLRGQQASIAAGATAKESVSLGDTATGITSTGTSDSYQLGNSIKTINVPATIHEAIAFEVPTSSTSIDATADVDIESGTNWAEVTSSKTASATVGASVTPGDCTATSPVSSIPTSGVYLYQLNGELSPYAGYTTQYAILFDFAYFA